MRAAEVDCWIMGGPRRLRSGGREEGVVGSGNGAARRGHALLPASGLCGLEDVAVGEIGPCAAEGAGVERIGEGVGLV